MCKSSRVNSARKQRKQSGTSSERHIPIPPYPYTIAILRAGLARLPQELIDIVKDFVFAAPADSMIRYISKSTYKPPVQLQIDRRSREEFKDLYYGAKTSYIFTYNRGKSTKPHADAIYGWFRSLEPSTQLQICTTMWTGRPLHPSNESSAEGGSAGVYFPELELPGLSLPVKFEIEWVDRMGRERAWGKKFEVLWMGYD